MDLDGYLAAVDRVALAFAAEAEAVHELIERRGVLPDLLDEMVAFRRSFIDDADRRRLAPFLEFGFFRHDERDTRLASFALTFEVENALGSLRLRRQCEPYRRDHPLFRAAPSLFDRARRPDNELLDLAAVNQVDDSEVFEAPGGHGRLLGWLSPALVHGVRAAHPQAPMYVRLDPYDFSVRRPPRRLDEAAVIPANPKWLAPFSLRKGMKDRGHYVLEDGDPKTDMARVWDYRFRHVRRLECRVERREQDYLTVMVEELPRADDPLMVGRCVHFDTRDPAGTDLAAVVLSHLDLAINVYEGARRQERWDARLADGKVPDASFRTHLFRVEGVPFLRAFDCCRLFFRSAALLDEWLDDLDPGGKVARRPRPSVPWRPDRRQSLLRRRAAAPPEFPRNPAENRGFLAFLRNLRHLQSLVDLTLLVSVLLSAFRNLPACPSLGLSQGRPSDAGEGALRGVTIDAITEPHLDGD